MICKKTTCTEVSFVTVQLRERRLAALGLMATSSSSTIGTSSNTWKHDLAVLQATIDTEIVPRSNIINVDRENVFECFSRAFQRKNFCALHSIDVCFVDCDGSTEGAVDSGGPSREFFRLLLTEIKNGQLFEGPEDARHLGYSAKGLCSLLHVNYIVVSN